MLALLEPAQTYFHFDLAIVEQQYKRAQFTPLPDPEGPQLVDRPAAPIAKKGASCVLELTRDRINPTDLSRHHLLQAAKSVPSCNP